MASIEELKKIIVDLRMDLVRESIPRGHCPYAYYSTSKQKDREGCDDIDCSECMRNFLSDKKNDIIQEVMQL